MRYARRSGIDSHYLLGNLKNLDKWVCWRAVETDEGTRKKPTATDQLEQGAVETAQFKDRDNGKSYTEAIKTGRGYDILDGVQVIIDVSTDDFIVIDFDNCVNPDTGKIDPVVRPYLRMSDSYTELSPSGTGLHTIVRGHIPNQGWPDPDDAVDGEIFDKYIITVTGNHIAGTSYVAREDSDVLDQYFADHNVSWDELFY